MHAKSFFGIKITKPNEREIRGRENKRGKKEGREGGREVLKEQFFLLMVKKTFGPLQLNIKATAAAEVGDLSWQAAGSQGLITCKHCERSGDEKVQRCHGKGGLLLTGLGFFLEAGQGDGLARCEFSLCCLQQASC